ncbi:hypothetical protein AFB00_29885 (plasmid) [Pseudonocardia sp. HH130630-07]|nr:hypothetical protein AFB00_29885 [Pseudonocardia sp. HH130630-07]
MPGHEPLDHGERLDLVDDTAALSTDQRHQVPALPPAAVDRGTGPLTALPAGLPQSLRPMRGQHVRVRTATTTRRQHPSGPDPTLADRGRGRVEVQDLLRAVRTGTDRGPDRDRAVVRTARLRSGGTPRHQLGGRGEVGQVQQRIGQVRTAGERSSLTCGGVNLSTYVVRSEVRWRSGPGRRQVRRRSGPQ